VLEVRFLHGKLRAWPARGCDRPPYGGES
jgi:hypothetical protein